MFITFSGDTIEFIPIDRNRNNATWIASYEHTISGVMILRK